MWGHNGLASWDLTGDHGVMCPNLPPPKIRHTVCQLSGVSIWFHTYHPCLHLVDRNTRVYGANFIVNRHKTRVNTKIIVLHSNVLTQPYQG